MLKTNHPLPIVFAVTLFLQLMGPSCRQRPMEEYGRRLERTDKAALHAVHSERLRQIMAELERLSLNQLPQEMDVGAERQRQIESIEKPDSGNHSQNASLHKMSSRQSSPTARPSELRSGIPTSGRCGSAAADMTGRSEEIAFSQPTRRVHRVGERQRGHRRSHA